MVGFCGRRAAWRSRRSSGAAARWSWRTTSPTGAPGWSHGDESATIGDCRRRPARDADDRARRTFDARGPPDGSTAGFQRAGRSGARTSPPTTGAQPEWGRSGSPLVVDELIVGAPAVATGESLVAYDARDREPVWRGGDDSASYSSPMLVTLGGRPQMVVLNQSSCAGHDPARAACCGTTLAAHDAQRRDAGSRGRRRVLALGRVRDRQPALELTRRRWRHDVGVRLGEPAPEGQVHQPGAARRLRLRPRRRRAGVHGRRPANGDGMRDDTATGRRCSVAIAAGDD